MAYGDEFKDTPENREHMKRAAESYADMQGIVYIVVLDKSSRQLAVEPKSMFDPAREEILFEHSGGGRKAADERWEEILRKMEEGTEEP